MNMTNREINEENIKKVFVVAKKIFLEDQGLQPCLYVIRQGGKDTVKGNIVMLGDFFEDRRLTQSIKMSYQMQEGVVATIFISEAWISVVDKKKDKERFNSLVTEDGRVKIKPSEDPNRLEALVFLLESKVGTVLAHAPILREGKLAVGALEFSPATQGNEVVTGKLAGSAFN